MQTPTAILNTFNATAPRADLNLMLKCIVMTGAGNNTVDWKASCDNLKNYNQRKPENQAVRKALVGLWNGLKELQEMLSFANPEILSHLGDFWLGVNWTFENITRLRKYLALTVLLEGANAGTFDCWWTNTMTEEDAKEWFPSNLIPFWNMFEKFLASDQYKACQEQHAANLASAPEVLDAYMAACNSTPFKDTM